MKEGKNKSLFMEIWIFLVIVTMFGLILVLENKIDEVSLQNEALQNSIQIKELKIEQCQDQLAKLESDVFLDNRD